MKNKKEDISARAEATTVKYKVAELSQNRS